MAPSAGASSRTTSGTDSGATSGSPSESSTTSSGTPSGVRGSPSGAGPKVALTAASAAMVPMTEAVVSVAVAAPEGEGLGKKYDQRMKPTRKKKKGERRESWTNLGFQTTL
jgi:hypothetical protein